MKKSLILLSLFTLSVLVAFQNCSGFQPASETFSGFSIETIYPYQSKPSYYEDVQLVSKLQVGDQWNYQLIASIVNIENPKDKVDVRIEILDPSGNIFCPGVEKQVNYANNHIEIDTCESDLEPPSLEVVISVQSGSVYQEIRRIQLDLSSVTNP